MELLVHRGQIKSPQTRRYKYALRICPEPVHWGGLSGCTYQEGISWGKVLPPSEGGMTVEVPADATIAWPLVAKAVFERLEKHPPAPKHAVPEAQRGELWRGI